MRNGRISVGLALLLFSAALSAQVQFSSSAAINFKTGSYTPHLDPDTGFEFKNTTLDLGFTMFTNKFYVALNYDTTLKEDFTIINNGNTEVETTRFDHGITAGYDIGSGFGVFVGYKNGETAQESARSPGPLSFDVRYQDSGPLIGVSYGYNFGNPGSFSASIAYADFDGEIHRKNNVTGASQQTTGTTSGVSYGIKWTKEIRDGRTVAIGFKRQDYQFKDKAMGFGASQDLDQDFDIFYIQVSDFFD